MAGRTIPSRAVPVTPSNTAYITDVDRTPVNESAIQTTSVVVATDTITQTAHGYSNGDVLKLTNAGTVTNITVGNSYYIIGATTDTYQISATLGGSAVDLTGANTTPPTFQRLSSYGTARVYSASLFIGVGGDVVALPERHLDTDDPNPCIAGAILFKNLPSGSYLVGHFKKVFSTGTTATNIIAQHGA